MTRINLVDPKTLSGPHLVAEYRELPRIFGLVSKRLEAGKKFDDIPASYTMGPGHVRFFYDKLQFLADRQASLVKEMLRRNYSPSYTAYPPLDAYPVELVKSWTPTEADIAVSQARITERTK